MSKYLSKSGDFMPCFCGASSLRLKDQEVSKKLRDQYIKTSGTFEPITFPEQAYKQILRGYVEHYSCMSLFLITRA